MVYDSRLRPDHGGKDASTSDAQAIECCGTAGVKSAVCFERIEDGTPVRTYRLVDCLMSAVAMFGLKSPSLLQFDREVRLDGRVRGNLRRLYQVGRRAGQSHLKFTQAAGRLEPCPEGNPCPSQHV